MDSTQNSDTRGTTQRNSPSAVAAFVLGILGLTVLPLVGSVLALAFGYRSRQEVAENPDLYSDEFGRIGRILGWVGVAIAGVLVLIFIISSIAFMLPVLNV